MSQDCPKRLIDAKVWMETSLPCVQKLWPWNWYGVPWSPRSLPSYRTNFLRLFQVCVYQKLRRMNRWHLPTRYSFNLQKRGIDQRTGPDGLHMFLLWIGLNTFQKLQVTMVEPWWIQSNKSIHLPGRSLKVLWHPASGDLARMLPCPFRRAPWGWWWMMMMMPAQVRRGFGDTLSIRRRFTIDSNLVLFLSSLKLLNVRPHNEGTVIWSKNSIPHSEFFHCFTTSPPLCQSPVVPVIYRTALGWITRQAWVGSPWGFGGLRYWKIITAAAWRRCGQWGSIFDWNVFTRLHSI